MQEFFVNFGNQSHACRKMTAVNPLTVPVVSLIVRGEV